MLVYSNENTSNMKNTAKDGGTISDNKIDNDNILSPKSINLLKPKKKKN